LDASLTDNSLQDIQNLATAFGNTTVSYGSDAYIFNSNQQWTQERPFQWSEFIQTDDNLTLYSPYTGLPSDSQVINMSFVVNMKIEKSSAFTSTPVLLSSTYLIPNSVSL